MFKQNHTPVVVLVLTLLAVLLPYPVPAQDRAGILQGVVKDSSGAPVSGAFVKMKNAERRLTFMIITQGQGRYSLSNLPTGKYVLQAIGGEYQSEPSAPVDVASGAPVTVNLSLTAARAPQLPGAWPGRLPGEQVGEGEGREAPPALPDGEGKQIVEAKCVSCHDAQRIVRIRADRDRWQTIVQNMRAYTQGSTIAKPLTDDETKVVMDYVLANFSGIGGTGKPAPDPNSRLPRALLKGDSTKYIAVEFELPNNKAEPHEVAVDLEGNGWVTQRVGGKLGRFDPKTLTYTEIA